jgi:hypothetical protein
VSNLFIQFRHLSFMCFNQSFFPRFHLSNLCPPRRHREPCIHFSVARFNRLNVDRFPLNLTKFLQMCGNFALDQCPICGCFPRNAVCPSGGSGSQERLKLGEAPSDGGEIRAMNGDELFGGFAARRAITGMGGRRWGVCGAGA